MWLGESVLLLKIYGHNRSFKGYASNLLAMEWVLYQHNKPVPQYIDFDDRYCAEPFQILLAKHVASGKPLPSNAVIQWMKLRPEFSLRTPARRCPTEFRRLFAHRYKEKYGDGLLIKPNKTPLKLEYHAASSSIRGDLQLKIPDLPNPFVLTAPLKKLSTLADDCTVELEPYSRLLGRKNTNPDSLAANALLPKELLARSANAQKLKSHLANLCRSGPSLISLNQLYECFDEEVPPKMLKKESEALATLIDGLEFGMAPDVRFHNIKPKPDEQLAVFPKGHGVDFRPSKEFNTVATILRLGAMVSQIDNDLSESEKMTLQNMVVENRKLTQVEKDSLQAFLLWCLHTPQSTAGIKQKLSTVSDTQKKAIGQILISVACADGHIDPKEVTQLEKLYTTLGLDKSQVTSDLHALTAASEPVTVKKRDPQTTHAIPQAEEQSEEAQGFSLDMELIRRRKEETEQVKDVLTGIFADPIEEPEEEPTPSSTDEWTTSPLQVLDEAHQSFFHRLLKQETWERSVLYEVCKELGLMIDGAMEVLNEWAFDNANAPLIEDGDPVYVDVQLAREIVDVQYQ